MANYCSTSVVIYGNEKHVEDLFNKLERLKNGKESRVKNTFGKLWEGNLLDICGIDWESVICRGSIEDYFMMTDSESGVCLRLDQSDAWEPNVKYLDRIIEKQGYKLKYVYLAEEPGNNLYVTSDTEKKFFSDRYKIEFIALADIPKLRIKEDDDCCEYFESEEEFTTWFSKYFVPVKSWAKAAAVLEEFRDDFSLLECVKFEIADDKNN